MAKFCFSRRHQLTLFALAIAGGGIIGLLWGNFARETKHPGDALRSSDATGRWLRHVSQEADARFVTRSRLRLVEQALITYSLLHAEALPETLEELVRDKLLEADAIRDGWARPFVYTHDGASGSYAVRSLGTDGVPSEDDVPMIQERTP